MGDHIYIYIYIYIYIKETYKHLHLLEIRMLTGCLQKLMIVLSNSIATFGGPKKGKGGPLPKAHRGSFLASKVGTL